MASSWFAIVLAFVEFARIITAYLTKKSNLAERQTQQENKAKADGHDLLLKALRARRQARAQHLDGTHSDTNPSELPDG